jgi:polyribonucleotide nucleotidyltransferase
LASELHIICVPSTAIGSIIGSGGANIKQIIRDSGAFCTVSSSRLWKVNVQASCAFNFAASKLRYVGLQLCVNVVVA